MHQPVTHLETAACFALLSPAQEPLVSLYQVDLPLQAAITHLFLVQVTQRGSSMQHAPLECLPVALRRLYIGGVDTFAEVMLLP